MTPSVKKDSSRLKLIQVEFEEHLDHVRQLFQEYAASLNFNLHFQDFDKEFAELPGEYVPPEGCILLALYRGQIAGCVALRRFSKGICEMKRMYVRPEFRGKGIGRLLALAIIKQACRIGYTSMRLDTIPSMKQATALYQSLGFKKIAAYRYNPIEGAMFTELILT